MRVLLFAVALTVAALCLSIAGFLVHPAAGWAVAGLTIAVWSWLVLSEVDG